MVEPLEIGVSKYEIAIFLDESITEVFRTDSEEFQSVILYEARRRMAYLKREHPERSYRVDNVPKGIRVRNAGLVHP